jgi:hypothetical protein
MLSEQMPKSERTYFLNRANNLIDAAKKLNMDKMNIADMRVSDFINIMDFVKRQLNLSKPHFLQHCNIMNLVLFYYEGIDYIYKNHVDYWIRSGQATEPYSQWGH